MKKHLLLTSCMVTVGMVVSAAACTAAEIPAVKDIVERANKAAYYAGDDSRVEVRMTITDAQGRDRGRKLIMLRHDVADNGDQKFYVYFEKPGDVRKMVFMVHKYLNKDDDRWLYLPALDLVKRIAASDKRTSFVGSHFVYEDVSGRGVNEDIHELTGTTNSHFILRNTPRDPDSVEFSYYDLWIDRATYLPMKAEYYDKEGRKYRLIETLEVRTIQGYPTVIKSRAVDLDAGGGTVAEFSDIRYDIGLDDKIFTERYLRRPPRELRK